MTRVLVVDDKEENAYYLRVLLSAHGYEVTTARHGAEALVLARGAPPEMIVSDLLMPIMDGYTLLRQWKSDARLKDVPFVVFTATYTEPEDERLALNLGADAFILKGAEPDVLLGKLEAVRTRASTSIPVRRDYPSVDDPVLLREYSETLIRKLEDKSEKLKESNRELERDIEARRRVEAALEEAQRAASERASVLDAIFESVPDTIVHVDLERRVKHINRVSPPRTRAEFIEHDLLETLAPDERAQMDYALRSVIDTGRAASFESTSVGGASYWNTLSAIVRDGRITGAVVVTSDITERKRTEAQLLVSDRMVSIGTLAAGVAHEINNPSTSVSANIAVARELLGARAPEEGSENDPPRDALEALAEAAEGAERVRMIVRDLKVFSRGEEDTRGPVDVEKVLDSTLRMAWNEIRHRARLTKVYGGVPEDLANESRLGQLFLNLVINAAQAIPEGDSERNEIRIETVLDAARSRVVVRVVDTGEGMPIELQRRLFTPFLTTKPVGVGTGLGLSICHRIVIGLGGTIDFSSTPGEGTTFSVSLPTSVTSNVPVAPPIAPASNAPRRGRVLVVDDEVAIAQAVRRVLSAAHDVFAANSATEAMALLEAGERFDVVLCDLMMPQITGMEFFASLEAYDAAQAAKVVFMTGGAFTEKARTFLDQVSNERIDKPFDIKALRALVNRAVR